MRKIEVITPEQVSINYQLADLGSRVGAVVIDLLIQMVAVVILIISNLAIMTYSPDLWSDSYGWIIGISLIIYMIISYVYYIWSEINFDGQTIGKKVVSIKVIRLNGQAAGAKHIVIRNLFKVLLDSLGFGVWMIILNKQSRRIGDLVGGTVVVHKLKIVPPEITSLVSLPIELDRILNQETKLVYQKFIKREIDICDTDAAAEAIKKLMINQCNHDEHLISKVELLFT